ncbi:uncharacterized protein LTR77_001664 [Saxophila tyrrhenica]|uniref:Major facilitator superfamily (MFS) profile domain-containing protein n=1 Tax=Saxophila tyrrhenica TaxID=1690608 RepID=A0AAV9PL24_9PEZI|nr:hypothetical protein LTR77_001664 [Saxophila tyrrhenica]
MDHSDAIEAEVELEAEALDRESRGNGDARRRKTARAAKGDIEIPSSDDGEQEAGESSPLLARDEEDYEPEQWHGMDDFANVAWYRRPNILWVLAPFFLMACAFGGAITPKINLILELVCQRYISDQQALNPGFTMAPVDFNGGTNGQCRIPEVQEAVAKFTLLGGLLLGVVSAVTSPKLGALSDRYGRKPILVVTSVGTICGEIITILAATYPESFPVNLLLVGYAIDGLTGSFIVAMAIANAYATDCTPPAHRNVAFGYFHGALFSGIAIGPVVAGYIVKKTGQIVIVFYILLAVHLFFVLFISLLVPESLSKKRQLENRERHDQDTARYGVANDWSSSLRSLNILTPLKVLWPTGPGTSAALRWNLFTLAAVDTIIFGVAMGSISIIIIYTNYMFGWESFESGRFMTIVNSSRVICLLLILPALTRYVRGPPGAAKTQKNRGCDSFDLFVIRISVFFDTLGYVGYTLSRTGPMMILSGATAAIGGIGSPTLQSSMTKHVPADQTGQLLGASGLLHALARVVAPTVFSAIYAGTVKTFPQTVFVCLAATFGVAFGVSWFLRTGVYFDEEKAAQAADEPAASVHTNEGSGRIPIVSSVMAMFGAIAAWVGISGGS